MKQLKKMLLMMMCVCVMGTFVACGNNDALDNGANQTENANGTDTTMNDATDGTDDANGNGNGVVGEIGEDVVDGVEDVGEGVVDGVEDVGDGVKDAVDGNDTGNKGNDGAENKDVPKGINRE